MMTSCDKKYFFFRHVIEIFSPKYLEQLFFEQSAELFTNIIILIEYSWLFMNSEFKLIKYYILN